MDVLLTSGRIAGDWYYVRWTPVQEYDDYIMSYFDKTHLLKEMSDLYSGEIFLVSARNREMFTALIALMAATALRSIHGI